MTSGSAAAELRIVGSAGDAAVGAADAIVESLVSAVSERGVAHWATTGGSTAPAMYAALADPARTGCGPLGAVHVWWGDERFVPYDHPLSNVLAVLRPADRVTSCRSPAQNIHRIPTNEAIEEGRRPAGGRRRGTPWISRRRAWPTVDRAGSLDVVVLGMGPDGHILSVFPGSTVWDVAAPVVAVPAPTHIEPHVDRVTLHPSYLAAARRIVVVASGAAKADALAGVAPAEDVREIPARVAVRPGAIWFVDEAAAARSRADG